MESFTERPYWQPEIETMERDQLERLQAGRLRAQIARAAQSPFYRRLWEGRCSGNGAEIRTVHDVERLPFLHSHHLAEAQLREPPLGDLPAAPEDHRREVFPINSPGGALYTVYADDDLTRTAEIGARILWGCGLRPGDLIHNAFPYGLFSGGIMIHRAARAMGAAVIPIGTDSVKRQVEMLFNFKPAMLTGAPSHVTYLAERIRERGFSPRDVGLKAGLFGAEPGTAAGGRAKLEQMLGCPAFDLYGSAEVSTLLAAECAAQQGLHWAEDHVLVEVIDPETHRPCRDGERGVLVLTDLTRQNMPLLRYWTGDMALLVRDRCPCGRTHARSVGGICGRMDELVMYRGIKFYPWHMERILGSYGNLGDEYRVILERDASSWMEHATVIVEAAPGGPMISRGLEERLQRQLRDELGAEFSVEIVSYGSLVRSVTRRRRVEDRR